MLFIFIYRILRQLNKSQSRLPEERLLYENFGLRACFVFDKQSVKPTIIKIIKNGFESQLLYSMAMKPNGLFLTMLLNMHK